VGCTSDADCGTGALCKAFACAKATACTSDAVCKADKKVCDKALGACADCVTKNDCGTDEACIEHACVAAPACVSTKQCSVGVCDTKAGHCVECVDNADCAGGAWCSPPGACLPAMCKALECVGNKAYACKDGVYAAPADCDDGDACTSDLCEAGKGCAHGSAEGACDDKNPCTDDECTSDQGCVHVGNLAPCDDGDVCTTGDTCKAGECVGGPPKACDDGDLCTKDACDVASGACMSSPKTCDDGIACTTDACDKGTGACSHTPQPGCSVEGKPCATKAECPAGTCDIKAHLCVDCLTTGECAAGAYCSKRACVASVPCTSDSACKATLQVCDKDAGVCVPCLSELDCDTGEACIESTCVKAKACVSSKDCASVCDTANSVCVECASSTDCAKGSYCASWKTCTKVVCFTSQCSGGGVFECLWDGSGFAAPTSCDDANVCTTDTCDAKGCAHAAIDAVCNDGNACTTADACVQGTCAGSEPKVCDDGSDCTEDGCDAATGSCTTKPAAGACDDGDDCTKNDTCVTGACKGEPKTCDDANACTIDACVAGGACVHDPAVAGTPCSGGACDGKGACAVASVPAGMVLIPAGSFKMGCVVNDACDADEKPQHSVEVAAFFMDVDLVTAPKYKACVDAGKCTAPKDQSFDSYCNWDVGKDQHPINCVNWKQADTYCKWTEPKGRLPTEAEWERAARGGLIDSIYVYGSPPTCAGKQENTACFYQGGPGCGMFSTCPVTFSATNGYGLRDMVGNLWHWVGDWYDASYYGVSPSSNPVGPANGSQRSLRGSSFGNDGLELRASRRGAAPPEASGKDYGFRCARSVWP